MSWLFFLLGFSCFATALGLRHQWFQTGAWDLAIFDQAVSLIGAGQPAHSSLLGFHILGDHGALVLYPLGWLSRLVPSLPLLIGLQSAALAAAVFPLDRLAKLRGLNLRATAASLAVLLLYPVLFNTAIFDFHPEVLAFPLVLQVLFWLERQAAGDDWRVMGALGLALTCKVSLALLVIGFGLVVLGQRRRPLGAGLVVLGVAWLAIVGGWLMPAFGGEAAQLTRHSVKFGTSSPGAGPLHPFTTLLANVVSLSSLEYLLLLLVPVAYVLLHRSRARFFSGLLPFTPLLLLNLMASRPALKDLVHHYSLLLVPFLAAGVQRTLASGPGGQAGYPAWMAGRAPSLLVGWALVWFLLLSRLGFFFGTFQSEWPHTPQLRAAMALVRPEAALLTNAKLAPHLAHRPVLAIPSRRQLDELNRYDQVLLDTRHPGAAPERLLHRRLTRNPLWRVQFAEKDVWLFERRIQAES